MTIVTGTIIIVAPVIKIKLRLLLPKNERCKSLLNFSIYELCSTDI